MRPWQFSKPKNPGFGISGGFYMSVLSSASVLPSILEVVNPQGQGGAVVGFGAPLSSSASKESLSLPLERGAYAVATKDRKTVLKMLVLSKEEAGFDPEAFARSAMARDASPELLSRIRGTWSLAQFTFEAHDAMVYPALDFLLGILQRISVLAEGVVADPICQRYRLPEETIQPVRVDPRVDARDHVTVKFRQRPEGIHAYTLGMQKFGLPEFEITGLFPLDQDLAARFLIVLTQSVLIGALAKPGERYGSPKALLQVSEGGFDRGLWEGIPVYELLPPTSMTASDALKQWAVDSGLL